MHLDEFNYKTHSRDSESGILKFFRCFLMAMNTLITIAAVGGLVVGLLERNRMEATLQELCVHCKDVFLIYIIIFASILAFSLLGFLALCTRNLCLRALYFFFLFIVFIVALSISIIYLLVTRGIVSLDDYWNDAVKGGNAMCGLELEFQCSGWKSLCRRPIVAALPLSLASDLLANETNCPACNPDDQAKIDSYGVTCETVVIGALKENSKGVLPAGFSVAGIALLAMIVTCLAYQKIKSEERYGDYYYRV